MSSPSALRALLPATAISAEAATQGDENQGVLQQVADLHGSRSTRSVPGQSPEENDLNNAIVNEESTPFPVETGEESGLVGDGGFSAPAGVRAAPQSLGLHGEVPSSGDGGLRQDPLPTLIEGSGPAQGVGRPTASLPLGSNQPRGDSTSTLGSGLGSGHTPPLATPVQPSRGRARVGTDLRYTSRFSPSPYRSLPRKAVPGRGPELPAPGSTPARPVQQG